MSVSVNVNTQITRTPITHITIYLPSNTVLGALLYTYTYIYRYMCVVAYIFVCVYIYRYMSQYGFKGIAIGAADVCDMMCVISVRLTCVICVADV